MSDNHNQLCELINDQRLRIISILGTRRSGSTIAAKCLAQIADIVLDSPFNTAFKAHNNSQSPILNIEDNAVYDTFCGLILSEAVKKKSGKQPLIIVVKGTSGRMGRALFNKWVQLPSSFLVTFRDPAAQLISLARARYKREAKDASKLSKVSDFFGRPLPELDRQKYPQFNGSILELNQFYWDSLTKEVRAIFEMNSARNEGERAVPITFLEATLMRFNPQDAWASVLNELGFHSDNLGGILKGNWKANMLSTGRETSSFKERVSRSDGIQPLSLKERVDIKMLHPSLQGHIQKLTPIYTTLLRASQNYLPSAYVLQDKCCGTDCFLKEVNPFVAEKVLEVQGVSRLRTDIRTVLCPEGCGCG
ncbi:MAG: hypothetical protein P4M13_04610 [Alphaproteobacteria bacterium]|nr:hypothetical protein [Alphaproteobacteria bacterium]